MTEQNTQEDFKIINPETGEEMSQEQFDAMMEDGLQQLMGGLPPGYAEFMEKVKVLEETNEEFAQLMKRGQELADELELIEQKIQEFISNVDNTNDE